MTNEELDALDWEVAKLEGALNTCRAAWTEFHPSRNWAQGGPIIEREGIALQRWLECGWLADTWNFKFVTGHSQGSTALIAAMRCYISQRNLERN